MPNPKILPLTTNIKEKMIQINRKQHNIFYIINKQKTRKDQNSNIKKPKNPLLATIKKVFQNPYVETTFRPSFI